MSTTSKPKTKKDKSEKHDKDKHDKDKQEKIARQKSTAHKPKKLERHPEEKSDPPKPIEETPETPASTSPSSTPLLQKAGSIKVIPSPNWDAPSPRGSTDNLPSGRVAQVAAQKKAAGLKKIQDLEREQAEKAAKAAAEATPSAEATEDPSPESRGSCDGTEKKKEKPKPLRSKSSKHMGKRIETHGLGAPGKKRSSSSKDLTSSAPPPSPLPSTPSNTPDKLPSSRGISSKRRSATTNDMKIEEVETPKSSRKGLTRRSSKKDVLQDLVQRSSSKDDIKTPELTRKATVKEEPIPEVPQSPKPAVVDVLQSPKPAAEVTEATDATATGSATLAPPGASSSDGMKVTPRDIKDALKDSSSEAPTTTPTSDLEGLSDEDLKKALEQLETRITALQVENENLQSQLRKEEAQISQLSALLEKTADPSLAASPRAPRTKNDVDLVPIVPLKRPTSALASKQNSTDREKAVLELLYNEQEFTRNVNLIKQVYEQPLLALVTRVASFKLRDADIASAFKGTDDLVNLVNSEHNLYSQLEERVSQWETNDQIGDLFEKLIPTSRKMYLLFAKCYHDTKKNQHRLNENVTFRKQVEEIDDHVRSFIGFDLGQLFKLPIDRMRVLGAQLKKIQEATPTDHKDFESLGRACDSCLELYTEVTSQIELATKTKAFNEVMSRQNGFERLGKEPAVTRYHMVSDDETGEFQREFIVRTLEFSSRDISNLIDVNDPKRHIKKKEVEILIFNDIVVASPFLQKRNPPQEFFVPLDISMFQVLDSQTAKKKFPKIEISEEHIILITGPESQWIITLKTEDQKNEIMKVIKNLQPRHSESGTQATYVFSGDKGTYSGEWFRACPNGAGQLTAPNGKVFTGHWNAEFRCGFGDVLLNGELIGPSCGWKDTGATVEFIPKFWDSVSLTDSDWKLIMTGAEQVTHPKNTLLIEQGKKNVKLIRVKKGSVRIEREKGITALTLGPGTVVGDTAVITEIKEATVSVFTNEDNTELEEISVNLLFNLLKNNDALCMRFFRDMAKKLSGQLRRLQIPSKEEATKKKEDEEKKDHTLKPSGGIPKLQQAAASPAMRFGLRENESVVQATPCVLRERFSKSGTLYLFHSILIFEFDQKSFGLAATLTFPYEKIKKHKYDEKKEMLIIEKKEFVGVPDVKQFHSVLVSLMEEHSKKGSKKANLHSSKAELYSGKKEVVNQSITLDPKDIELILKGAIEKKYKSGEPVVVEGTSGLQRLYQVASGSCIVKKNIDGEEKNLATIPSGAMFGELSFVEEGAATASVIADGDVTIHILEGWYINSLFVDTPSLAGKFYSYLCSIVAKRLNEREMELVKASKK